MKRTEAIMEILAAYDLTQSFRDAAELTGCSHHTVARYVRARDAFGAPRYRVLYRAWLRQGPAVLSNVVSPVLADAIARRSGTLETQVLSHPYLHLAPLVTTA